MFEHQKLFELIESSGWGNEGLMTTTILLVNKTLIVLSWNEDEVDILSYFLLYLFELLYLLFYVSHGLNRACKSEMFC